VSYCSKLLRSPGLSCIWNRTHPIQGLKNVQGGYKSSVIGVEPLKSLISCLLLRLAIPSLPTVSKILWRSFLETQYARCIVVTSDTSPDCVLGEFLEIYVTLPAG
jgi:hypothetical protein